MLIGFHFNAMLQFGGLGAPFSGTHTGLEKSEIKMVKAKKGLKTGLYSHFWG